MDYSCTNETTMRSNYLLCTHVFPFNTLSFKFTAHENNIGMLTIFIRHHNKIVFYQIITAQIQNCSRVTVSFWHSTALGHVVNPKYFFYFTHAFCNPINKLHIWQNRYGWGSRLGCVCVKILFSYVQNYGFRSFWLAMSSHRISF